MGLNTPLLHAQADDRTHVVLGEEDVRPHNGFSKLGNPGWLRELCRIFNLDHNPGSVNDLINHRGRSGDEIEIVFPFQAFLDDLHVQHAEEAAPKAEAQRLRCFRLEAQRSIIQAELFQCLAKGIVVRGIDRIEAGKDLGLDLLESGKRFCRRLARMRDRIANTGTVDFLDSGNHISHVAGIQRVDPLSLRRENANLVGFILALHGHHADPLACAQSPIHDPDKDDRPEVVVEPGVHNQCLQGSVCIATGRRNAVDDGFEDLRYPFPGLGTGANRVLGIDADDVLDLGDHPLRIGGRQVDLVEHRKDLEIQFRRGVAVGHGLRLDTLGGVNYQ